MNEFIEKLIGRLEELGWVFADYYPDGTEIHRERKKSVAYDDVVKTINQLAEEYNNKSVKGDLISRSAVIKLIENKCVDGCLEQDDITLIDAYGLMDDVSDLPTAYNNGWIPCSERLPEKNGMYLVTQKRYSLDTRRMIGIETDYVQFSCGEWCRARFLEVIAWQPLPEPYQPKGE